MKQSIANKDLKSKNLPEIELKNQELEEDEELEENQELEEDEELEDLEDLDLMNPSDFIELISNNYICRKNTGRSRLKLHPSKINIKNY